MRTLRLTFEGKTLNKRKLPQKQAFSGKATELCLEDRNRVQRAVRPNVILRDVGKGLMERNYGNLQGVGGGNAGGKEKKY